MQLQVIQQKIFEIRGQKVMLDFDLAELYEVETRALNQGVKRNIDRFPEDFMFRLTKEEWNNLRSQIVILVEQNNENQEINSSQIVMSSRKNRGKSYLPYAFTEHGITMLSSVLNSDKAVKMNIAIVRAFIVLRKFAVQYNDLLEQLKELKDRVGNHDAQLNQIYDAIENLLDEKTEEKSGMKEKESDLKNNIVTKQYFKELAEFNLWANTIACGWLEQISDDQWGLEVVSSFNNIQQTVLHIISAEKAWVERFKKNPNIVWLQNEFKGTKNDHIALWKKTSEDFKVFIDDFDENDLQTNLDFKRLNGDAYSMPYYQLFAHVVNHGTYHRGQLVTMLRQVGFINIGSTDLLGIYRKKQTESIVE